MTGETFGVGLCVVAGPAVPVGRCAGSPAAWRLRRRGVHTIGVVVDQEQEPSDDFLTPVIEFTDRQGRAVRFRPAARGTGLGLDLGARAPALYLPEQPESARVFTRKQRLSRIVGPFAGGALLLGAAALATLTR